MKRYFGLLLAVVVMVGGIYWAYGKWKVKGVESARDLDRAQIQIDYLDRVGWIRVIPEEKAYKAEVTDFLRAYFKDVNEHLNKYGGNRNFDDYLSELSSRADKPGKNERLEEKKGYYDYVRKQFDLFKGGSYEPFHTSTDKGIRLDIVSLNPTRAGGEDAVRFQIVVWGLPREERTTDERGTKKVVVNASFAIHFKLTDEKGKLIAELDVAGDPASRVDNPERFVKFFPPQVLIGHYDVPLVPAEVKNAEITFTISSRSPTGGDIRSEHVWKLEPPAEWKLRPGEQWKGAQESVRPEDEIDPNKKGKR